MTGRRHTYLRAAAAKHACEHARGEDKRQHPLYEHGDPSPPPASHAPGCAHPCTWRVPARSSTVAALPRWPRCRSHLPLMSVVTLSTCSLVERVQWSEHTSISSVRKCTHEFESGIFGPGQAGNTPDGKSLAGSRRKLECSPLISTLCLMSSYPLQQVTPCTLKTNIFIFT